MDLLAAKGYHVYIRCVPVAASFVGAGVPHGMGLTMEGRGHTLRHVGNSISRHHEAHMEGAATMRETSYNTWFGEDDGGGRALFVGCYLAI